MGSFKGLVHRADGNEVTVNPFKKTLFKVLGTKGLTILLLIEYKNR